MTAPKGKRRQRKTYAVKGAMSWFRFYPETLHDPKIVRLSDRTFRGWVNILSIASITHGRLPPISDIASHLRMTMVDATDLVSDLVLAGLIDINFDKSLMPHGWDKRQFRGDNETSTKRVRHFRQRMAKGAVLSRETPDETFQKRQVNVSASVSVLETGNETHHLRAKHQNRVSRGEVIRHEENNSGEVLS